MSLHFMEKVNSMTRQAIDTAVIVDAKGQRRGKIIVRYTDSQIGWNNETGIIFHYGKSNLDFGKTVKGGAYDRSAVYALLSSIGAKVYGWRGLQYHTYSDKPTKGHNLQNVSGVSQCTDFTSFKIGNKTFKILRV